jgi:tight adherence protein B
LLDGFLLTPAVDQGLNVVEVALMLISFVAVVVFILVGHALFSVSWKSYEERYLEEAERTLEDVFITIPPQQLLFLGFAVAFLVLLVSYALTESLIFSAIFGIISYALPKQALKFYRNRRIDKFSNQLVDALSTLNNALRSGFALPKAFALLSKEMPKPLSQEFKILGQELRLGQEMDQALRNMYKRVPSEDLDLLITAISISQSVGGNLTEVFEKIAHTIRERHRIEGRIDALTAQGKMQGIVVGLLPLGMFLVLHLMDPETLKPLYTTWIGYGVLALVLVLEFLGFFVIRKICDIEV